MKNYLILKNYRMLIKKDELSRVFLSYSINSGNEIIEHTEGILKVVNCEIANAMYKYFDTDLISYRVEVFDENTEFVNQSEY
ncbi:hypothetical protein [Sulfurimonas sp.]|uniref:hypothetical protein n=1 Tax=Sulfurimonas sp. TaxID=2022749 RepID=UPI00286DAA3D|nr:hypothetical protein [Sulfurimonas sp.]